MGQSIITTWNGKGNYASYHLLEEERMTTASNKKFPVITVCNKSTQGFLAILLVTTQIPGDPKFDP